MLNVGDKAPRFSLYDQNNNLKTLDEYKNKKMILWFFPKANTPGWTIEGCGFRDKFQMFSDKGYIIIGVSADSPKKQKKFVEKYNFPFTMLCDENHDMLKDYKVWGLKKFMGREYMGISRLTYIINKSGTIEHVFEKVVTKSHAEDILNIIK